MEAMTGLGFGCLSRTGIDFGEEEGSRREVEIGSFVSWDSDG